MKRWKGNRKLLNSLFKEHQKVCSSCGVITRLPKSGNIQPDNMATIQHIYGIQDVRRYCEGGDKVVLFCRKCNSLDNIKQFQARSNFYHNNIKPQVQHNINICNL